VLKRLLVRGHDVGGLHPRHIHQMLGAEMRQPLDWLRHAALPQQCGVRVQRLEQSGHRCQLAMQGAHQADRVGTLRIGLKVDRQLCRLLWYIGDRHGRALEDLRARLLRLLERAHLRREERQVFGARTGSGESQQQRAAQRRQTSSHDFLRCAVLAFPELSVMAGFGVNSPASEAEGLAVTTLYAAGQRDEAPWGTWEVIAAGPRYAVKRIVVQPGKRVSLQSHEYRAEHWVVVDGAALVTRGSETFPVGYGGSVVIARGEVHRIANPGPDEL